MNPLFIIFVLAVLVAQFALPRRLAFAPLLVAVCHFQDVPVLQCGVTFSIFKLVIMAGLLRAWAAGTLGWSSRQPLDVLFALWAGWIILSGFAHHPKDHNPMTIRLSVVYDFVGAYFYARAFIKNREDFLRFIKCLAFVVLPLALMVLVERAMVRDFYGVLDGGMVDPEIRGGRVRAAGPFGHAILLGTFGATSVPLMVALWRRHPRWAFAGMVACGLIVFCSASSGPILTLFSGLLGLTVWHWRTSVRRIRIAVISTVVVLHLVMEAPVWFLMARIDLAGGSTGWHRAELISTALRHLNEWWLVGTDYTRNWMEYGVGWSANQIDITNHYIYMGVTGGLPLMLCFIAILIKAFQLLGRGMRPMREAKDPDEFILWCVGASLLAHCFTFLSISYFDQNTVVLGLVLGSVVGLCTVSSDASRVGGEEPCSEDEGDEIALAASGAQGGSSGRKWRFESLPSGYWRRRFRASAFSNCIESSIHTALSLRSSAVGLLLKNTEPFQMAGGISDS